MTTKTPQKPKIQYPKENPEKKKKAEEWDKSTLGKIGKFIGKAQAPMQDVDETIRWVKSRGKLKTGGPLGYTRQVLRDLGMGEKTADKMKGKGDIKKLAVPKKVGLIPPQVIERRLKKGEPVAGVGIGRKPISRTSHRAVRDF